LGGVDLARVGRRCAQPGALLALRGVGQMWVAVEHDGHRTFTLLTQGNITKQTVTFATSCGQAVAESSSLLLFRGRNPRPVFFGVGVCDGLPFLGYEKRWVVASGQYFRTSTPAGGVVTFFFFFFFVDSAEGDVVRPVCKSSSPSSTRACFSLWGFSKFGGRTS